MGKTYLDDDVLPELCLGSKSSVWRYCEYLMWYNYAALDDASIRERVCTDLKKTFEWGNLAHAIIMYHSYDVECPFRSISELVKLLEKLFDMGLDCNFRSSNHGFTFIHQAVFGTMDFLASDANDKDFDTSRYFLNEIVALIDLGVKIGFNFNLKCENGNTLAHMLVDPRICVRSGEDWQSIFKKLKDVDYNFAALNDAKLDFFEYAESIIKELESTGENYWTSFAYREFSRKEFYDLKEFFKHLIDDSWKKIGLLPRTMFGFDSCHEEELMLLEMELYDIRELGIPDADAISSGGISDFEILLMRLIQVRDCYFLKAYDEGDKILATVEAVLSESDECKSVAGRQSLVEDEKTLIENIIKHLKEFKFIYCKKGKKMVLSKKDEEMVLKQQLKPFGGEN